MTGLKRLALAGGLAGIAAVLNYVYVTSHPTGERFVRVVADVKRGELFSEEGAFEPLEIPQGSSEMDLAHTFVPYNKRGILFQAPAVRDYRAGDLVLMRDVEAQSTFAEQQPDILRFRVIAVGERFKRRSGFHEDVSSGSGSSTVTVAVKRKGDLNSERMIRVVQAQSAGDDAPPDLRVLGAVVFPRDRTTAGDDEGVANEEIEQPGPDEMALPVSLRNVESVPAVILAGGEIGFLLRPEYP